MEKETDGQRELEDGKECKFFKQTILKLGAVRHCGHQEMQEVLMHFSLLIWQSKNMSRFGLAVRR